MPNPSLEYSQQFQIGDRVMHVSQGSGQIVAIEEKRLSGREARRFYAVAINKSTIWVPVDSEGASNLRPLITNEALTHCRVLLKARPTTLSADRLQRNRDRAAPLQ